MGVFTPIESISKTLMNILADQQIPFAKQAFQQFGDVELIHGRDITHNNLDNVDILLVRSITKVNEELLDDTAVKFVGTATSGFDHIDQSYLKSHKIKFAYTPGSNARSVAEYVLSALLVLFDDELEKLQNSTVGIIGYGHVGSKVARFLEILGLRCLLNDPPLARQQASSLFVSLDEVLDADIITIHVPLIKEGLDPTYHLITETELKKVKDEAVLINTARGGVVDEFALLNKIKESSIKTVIDVWEGEPNINQELLQTANITTSHIAGYSTDGKLRATEMLYQKACEFFQQTPVWTALDTNTVKKNEMELVSSSMTLLESINKLVKNSYDILQDHDLLQASLKVVSEQRSSYFDELRKHYRERFEYIHTQYSISEQSDIDVTVLDKLGFNRVLNS